MTESVNDTSNLVQEVLDAAKKSEVAAHDTGKDTQLNTSDTKDSKETKGKAAERIQELVAERNKYSDVAETLKRELEATRQRELEFKSGYAELATLVESIKELAAHPDNKIKDAVMLVDQVLKGEYNGPTVATPGDQVKTDGNKELITKLDALKHEMENKIEDTAQKALLNAYKDSAKEAFEGLPKEYTDKDKDRIAQNFHDFINWEAVSKDPLKMDSFVQEALKTALDQYGDPIGRIENRIREEFKAKEPEAKRMTPEEQMKKLKEVPWDKADEKGKQVMSDQDFVKALAAAYKHDRSNL